MYFLNSFSSVVGPASVGLSSQQNNQTGSLLPFDLPDTGSRRHLLCPVPGAHLTPRRPHVLILSPSRSWWVRFSETRSARRKRKTFGWKVLEPVTFSPEGSEGGGWPPTRPAAPPGNLGPGGGQDWGGGGEEGVWLRGAARSGARPRWIHSRPAPCSVSAAGPRTAGLASAAPMGGGRGATQAPRAVSGV